ncbi:MAG: DUF523 domain-containing protein [Clostridia bacterium]|nr:DUF523 domain-containing protein [Clostridia bacterium]
MKKILVSACLLGIPCRYDGKSKPIQTVIDLKDKYNLIPICPETLGGLPIPRIPAEIQGDRVIRKDGTDVTLEYERGANKSLEIALENNCKIAILKAKSPSCGNCEIYDGTYTKTLIKGKGVTANLFEKNGILVINESELHKLNEDNSK